MYRPSAFLLLFISIASLSASAADDNPSPNVATHKQVFTLTPERDGRSVTLNTFTVNSEGNILACVSDRREDLETLIDGTYPITYWLQVYSPERVLLNEISLPFDATAINEAPSGVIFLAGNGQMASVSKDGKLIATADTPNAGSRKALIKQTELMIQQDIDETVAWCNSRVEKLSEKIKSLEAEKEPTERDLKRLESLRGQLKANKWEKEYALGDMAEEFYNIESIVGKALKVTSLAVNSKYVFVCCSAGGRYNVWRTNYHFSEQRKIVSHLSGCCGQCDIQADERNLILAENTKFKVSLLNLGGKRLTSFGSSAEENEEGFGSCCNPMNLRCCSNGDILTAESSIGWIKRFNKEGELVGTVGKARIAGGCKHVAIGVDEKLNRYYMQYQDRNQICVMLPMTEAPEFTVHELNAKKAREGFCKLLLGDGKATSSEWSVDGTRPKLAADEESQHAESANVDAAIDSGDYKNVASDETPRKPKGTVSYMKFSADGQLTKQGGRYGHGIISWEAVSQNDATKTLLIYQLNNGMRRTRYRMQFVDDNTMKVTAIAANDWEFDTLTLSRLPLEEK